ncbi:BatD family protein [Marinicella meishanensis]|uniref:BatD family protein n=1 Tax=Marinicella meishanensis TaxID=2873263 RepID=UPI001CC1A8E0|nr:BatD family protein [Marinicella sp. NBU2979]
MSRSVTGIIALSLLLLSSWAQAAIKAAVDRSTVLFGESLTLTITADKNTNSQPDFTLLDAVFHVGQTGKSSSTQIINGEVNTQTTWQVLLVPKSLGTHLIPPLEVDGERTETIKITVNKPDPNAQAKGDLFIELETNKDSAYVQEEILLTVRLMYAINLKNGALTEPGGDGVIVQQISKGANYTTQRDGKTYQVLERKYAIYAENSGPLTLNPLVFEGEVTDNSRQSFGLFQRGRPVRHVSEMLDLEIKQIPPEFVNQAWIPARQVTLQQSWSQDQPYRVGEPITRTINLTVAGQAETQLPELQLADIDGAKIYQDKTDTITRQDGQQLISSKVIKYAIIPTRQGLLEIPEFTLDWFDTTSQSGKVARIPATTLAVAAADASTVQAPQAVDFNPPAIQPTAVPIGELVSPEATGSAFVWQVLTVVFAALWLFTVMLWWRRPARRVHASAAEAAPNNPVAINSLAQATPSEVQQTLINWWNQAHEQRVTNLGQISAQLADGEPKAAIDALQQQLYGAATTTAEPQPWPVWIKQGLLHPHSQQAPKAVGLPGLYD